VPGLAPEIRARLVRRHLRPTARTHEGVALREAGVSAMVDVSDGLAGDLGHVLAASGVGALLNGEALPISADLRAYCGDSGADPLSLVLEGGEDYELVFTVPPAAEARVQRLTDAGRVTACRIGRIEAGPGLRMALRGDVRPIAPRGYEHFT